jgi:glutamine amidotransferase
VLGETDSEVVFFIFLSLLAGYGPLARRHAVDDVTTALKSTLKRVREICDSRDESAKQRSLLSVLVTDGDTMVAAHGGKELFWSTYKARCSDRETCPSLSAECEAESKTGFVNHFIVSSEPLQGENVWLPLEEGDIVGVDWRMRVARSKLGRVELPLAGE